MRYRYLSHYLLCLLSTLIVLSFIGCNSNDLKEITPSITMTNNVFRTETPSLQPTQSNSLPKTPFLPVVKTPELPTREITAEKIKELKINKVNAFAWSPDSTSFVIAGRFESRFGLALFTVLSEQPKWFIESGPIFGLTFSPDGKYVVFSPSTGVLTFLEAENGTKAKEFVDNYCAQGVYSSMVTFENQVIAGFSSGGKDFPFTTHVNSWNIEKGLCEANIINSQGLLSVLDVNLNGNLSLDLSRIDQKTSFEVQVWDIKSGSLLCRFENGTLSSLNSNGKEIVVIQMWRQGNIWDITPCQINKRLSNLENVGNITLSPKGDVLGIAEQQIEFFDLQRDISIYKIVDLPNSPSWPSVIEYSPDGSLFLAVIPKINDQTSDVVVIWRVTVF